jgi:hypothetical protein
MDELNKLGVKFALDDFGTGYSSLTHLKELSVDTIKIDRSFINDMLYNTQDMAIVNAIISLSKVFQIEVVAEGPENIEQLLMLLDLGCDYIQGYTVARPMDYQSTIEYMKNFTVDPRWKIVTNSLPRRADFELLLALSNHKYWVELVIDNINREDIKDIPQLSHQACRLGKWLHANGSKYFSKYRSFNELVSIHKRVHKQVKDELDRLEHTEFSKKEQSIEKILDLKDSLIATIEKLKIEHDTDTKE